MKIFCSALAIVSLILAALATLAARPVSPAPSAAMPQTSPSSSAPAASSTPAGPQPSERKVTEYTLPPDLYKKAHDLGRINFRFRLISFVYGLVVLWIVLAGKLAAKYRTWAEAAASRRFLQALIFAPLLVATTSVLGLPADTYEQSVERAYGLSIQGWSSWTWDWIKGLLISVVIGTILIRILYAVIRKSPRRWWFYFWLVSLPLGVFLIFLQPLVIDPMFHKFEPLAQKDPPLTASLERMVQRAGEDIPPERMFWMGASEKLNEVNAYVTGLGASKRVVVWDTTIAKMTTPQIVYVAGHEMGHYVLHHIWKGLAVAAVLLFIFFYLGFRSIGGVLSRWGANWQIRGLDDWASLPALLFLISVFSFVANPVASAFSRYIEHQADQYGLEVTHGLTPDSSQVGAQSFQVLGEVDLDDPDPNPVNVFLFYSHPPIRDRVHFALTYNPWANGGHGEFVP